MSTPRVSVAIPVRNGMPYLPQAVASALADLPEDGEVVIRNNLSTDGTREWLDTLTDPRVRVIDSETDDSAPTNFTKVCQEAQGEWVTFLCADDYLLPGGLTRLLEVAESADDAVLVASRRRVVTPTGRTVLKAHGLKGLIGDFDGREAISRSITTGTNAIGESNLMRREPLRASLPFTSEYPYLMDFDLYAKVLTHGRFVGLDSVDSAYRLSPQSESVRTGRGQLHQLRAWVENARRSGLLRLSPSEYAKARVMIPLKFGARLAIALAAGLTGRGK